MTVEEKIKNSIRAYVMADAMGVPYEFRRKGTFNCVSFSEGGYHNQPSGTWSDDSSILLCLMDALSDKSYISEQQRAFRENLRIWFYNQGFNAGSGMFDIGSQTRTSIILGSDEETDSMGNGALFYALPIAAKLCKEDYSEFGLKRMFELFCTITHNNRNCFKFGGSFCWLIRNLLLDLPIESIVVESYENRGDVINTYNLVIDNFLKRKDSPSPLFSDICHVINLGEDTDTNAALFAALMGTKKEVDFSDWEQIRRYKDVDNYIDTFINSLGL